MYVLGERGHFGMLSGQNTIDLEVFNYKIRKLGYYIFSPSPLPSLTHMYTPPTPQFQFKIGQLFVPKELKMEQTLKYGSLPTVFGISSNFAFGRP